MFRPKYGNKYRLIQKIDLKKEGFIVQPFLITIFMLSQDVQVLTIIFWEMFTELILPKCFRKITMEILLGNV